MVPYLPWYFSHSMSKNWIPYILAPEWWVRLQDSHLNTPIGCWPLLFSVHNYSLVSVKSRREYQSASRHIYPEHQGISIIHQFQAREWPCQKKKKKQLAAGRCSDNLKKCYFHTQPADWYHTYFLRICCHVNSTDPVNDNLTLVLVMAWCRHTTWYYLNQWSIMT